MKAPARPGQGDSASTVSIELQFRLPPLLLVLLLLVALILPSRIWNTLLVGLGGLFLIAYFWARQLAAGLRARRRLQFGWVAVGDRLQEEFEIANLSAVPGLWVEVIDYSNVPGYRPAVVRSIGPNGVDHWRVSAICQRRGQYQLGPWALRSGDPFGIFRVTRRYQASNQVVIHPPIHGDLAIPLPVGQSSGRVRSSRPTWAAALNAAGVRQFQPGDPKHWIHWPTSARHGELFVRQFDRDEAGTMWILLDLAAAAQLGQGADGTEEHAVLLAASLAARGLNRNRAVGLAIYSQQPQIVPAGRGTGQRWRILRALALAKAEGEIGLSAYLRDLGRIADRGSAAVIITPSADPGWLPSLLELSRQGIQSNVVLLDRRSFGGSGNSQSMSDFVRHLGFSGHLIRQGEVGRPLDDTGGRGFWKFRVTALGKVITIEDPYGRRRDAASARAGGVGRANPGAAAGTAG